MMHRAGTRCPNRPGGGGAVEVTIERIGTLPVTASAAGATACPTRGAGRGA
jgi:hypothetical protein